MLHLARSNIRVFYISAHRVLQKEPFEWWIGTCSYKKIPQGVSIPPIFPKSQAHRPLIYPLELDLLARSVHLSLGGKNY